MAHECPINQPSTFAAASGDDKCALQCRAHRHWRGARLRAAVAELSAVIHTPADDRVIALQCTGMTCARADLDGIAQPGDHDRRRCDVRLARLLVQQLAPTRHLAGRQKRACVTRAGADADSGLRAGHELRRQRGHALLATDLTVLRAAPAHDPERRHQRAAVKCARRDVTGSADPETNRLGNAGFVTAPVDLPFRATPPTFDRAVLQQRTAVGAASSHAHGPVSTREKRAVYGARACVSPRIRTTRDVEITGVDWKHIQVFAALILRVVTPTQHVAGQRNRAAMQTTRADLHDRAAAPPRNTGFHARVGHRRRHEARVAQRASQRR